VDYLLRGLGLITHYQSDKSEGPDRILNIGQLYEGALTFSNNFREEKGLEVSGEEITTAWLEHISLVTGVDVVEGNISKSKAFVMTAHSSKGREFDNVYVAGIEQGLFPFVKYGEEINEEEERRLLFVATSRAKQKLTLSYAERRYLYGRSTDQRPSIFLKNLPDTVIRIKKVGEMKGKIYQ
jgi:DNA helicase-2/ATP-dependent DNA helicase PcrA